MIEFLKESTFAVNDVINKAWHILKEQYFLIAGLCFLMFLTLNISNSLAQFIDTGNQAIRIILMLVFIIIYFGLQLTLFNFTLKLIDSDNNLTEEFFKIRVYNYLKLLLSLIGLAILCSVIIWVLVFLLSYFGAYADLSVLAIISLGCIASIIWLRKKIYPFVIVIKSNWPSRKQLVNFLLATICSVILLFLAVLVMAVLFYPLNLTGVKMQVVVDLAISLGIILAMVVLIRISFFPLFIMDRNCNPFKSLRFSLAITRGNFTRLLLLLCFLAIFHLMAWYFAVKDLGFLVIIVNTINSFFIIPLSSLVTSVAYRQMMSEYRGDEDPDVIHNLI